MTTGPAYRGRVVAFSSAVGLGWIETQSEGRYRFHCVEIADGSRTIDVGDEVTFDVIAKLGSWEAANLRP